MAMSDEERKAAKAAWMKAKRESDPEYRAKLAATEAARRKAKRESDPEYRAKLNALQKAKRESDPEYRAKLNATNAARDKERRRSDPEYRAKLAATSAAWMKAKRASDPESTWLAERAAASATRMKTKYESDPEYRAKCKAVKNARMKAKRESDPEWVKERAAANAAWSKANRNALIEDPVNKLGITWEEAERRKTLRTDRSTYHASPKKWRHLTFEEFQFLRTELRAKKQSVEHPKVESVELSDSEFVVERNALTKRLLGITGTQFVKRFRSGTYDDPDTRPDPFDAVMAWFPELDDEGF